MVLFNCIKGTGLLLELLVRIQRYTFCFFFVFKLLNSGYERMKELFKRKLETEELPFYIHLLSASVANSFAAVVTNPLDVIKTRFQVQRRNKEENNYQNFSDAFSKILKGEVSKKSCKRRVFVVFIKV
jgi:hypothetical protein